MKTILLFFYSIVTMVGTFLERVIDGKADSATVDSASTTIVGLESTADSEPVVKMDSELPAQVKTIPSDSKCVTKKDGASSDSTLPNYRLNKFNCLKVWGTVLSHPRKMVAGKHEFYVVPLEVKNEQDGVDVFDIAMQESLATHWAADLIPGSRMSFAGELRNVRGLTESTLGSEQTMVYCEACSKLAPGQKDGSYIRLSGMLQQKSLTLDAQTKEMSLISVKTKYRKYTKLNRIKFAASNQAVAALEDARMRDWICLSGHVRSESCVGTTPDGKEIRYHNCSVIAQTLEVTEYRKIDKQSKEAGRKAQPNRVVA